MSDAIPADLPGLNELAERHRALQKKCRELARDLAQAQADLRAQRRLEPAGEFNFYLKSVMPHEPGFQQEGEQTFEVHVAFRQLDLMGPHNPDHAIDYRFRQLAEMMKAERKRQLAIKPGAPAPTPVLSKLPLPPREADADAFLRIVEVLHETTGKSWSLGMIERAILDGEFPTRQYGGMPFGGQSL